MVLNCDVLLLNQMIIIFQNPFENMILMNPFTDPEWRMNKLKKKGCYYKLITQFNLSGKWQYNEIPRYTIILINLMMDYVLHNLIYTSIWSGSSKIPLISGAQWYLIYLNFYILVKTGSIYDLFLKNLIFFSSPISILYTGT